MAQVRPVFSIEANFLRSDRSSEPDTRLFGKKKGLLTCSLNAPSLLKHKVEIEMLLRKNKIDILALNETKISDIVSDTLISTDGYNHEQCDRNRYEGEVLVYIGNTIAYDRLHENDIVPDHNCTEAVTIQIELKCATLFAIMSWYRPPNHNTHDILNIERIYKVHHKTNFEIIIMGDLNCDDLPEQDKTVLLPNSGAFIDSTNSSSLSRNPPEPQKDPAHYLTISLLTSQILLPPQVLRQKGLVTMT